MADETRTPTPEEIAANVKKAEAEAAKALADAKLAEAGAEKALAEAAEYREGARQAKAEADSAEMATEKYGIALERERRNRAEELADDDYHHIYRFSGTVDPLSSRTCLKQLMQWHRLDPTCDMEIIFTSPGGSIIDGMCLYDTILEMRELGHRVTTTTRGWAASMAGILLQAGDVRVMGKQAYVLIHEAAFAAMGKVGEVRGHPRTHPQDAGQRLGHLR